MNKVIRKFKALSREIRKNLEAGRIALWASYDRIRPPELDLDYRASLWSEQSPFSRLLAENSNAVGDADRILEKRFRVFAFEVDASSSDFSWHKDFRSGFIYPKVPYPKIQSVPDDGNDIIIPWELSRMQFIPTLIQAHRVTGDTRYARFFEEIVTDWIAENPYLIGVNWRTGMDPAIRAINIGLGLLHFYDHLEYDVQRYTRVLWAHAERLYVRDFKRIRRYLNNHFLVSALGLLTLSLWFRGNRAERFFEVAMGHLSREIVAQFRSDGGNFESAIHYHQLSLETVLLAACFLSVKHLAGSETGKGYQFPHEAEERMKKALTLVGDYMNAFGRSPQFGDSDDGRILIFKDYYDWNPLDHVFLENTSKALFAEKSVPSNEVANHVYPNSGYGFFKNDTYGVCFNASPVEKSTSGGHNHCDKTSFVLQVRGKPVFIDSGTYCYGSDAGARFEHKRTRAHNVVMIDGREQIEIDPQVMFGDLGAIRPRIDYEICGGIPEWKMEHDGYCQFEGTGLIRRIIRCAPLRMDIEEHIEGRGEHGVDMIFNLHPKIHSEIRVKDVHFIFEDEQLCQLEVPDGFRVSMESGYYSRAYTVREAHEVIVLSCRRRLPLTVNYVIHFQSPVEHGTYTKEI
ncbi:MAG: alginate lyase family protein [Planctomycetota bacterium]|nr:MAG: alginate lyase family protein [Planctomycetota bacterium]